MATALRTPTKGIVSYNNMSSSIQLDLNIAGLSGKVSKLIATDFDDVVTADTMAYRQVLNVGGGNDTMMGGGLLTTYDGGAGIDTVDYTKFDGGVNADLARGMSDSGDVYVSVENLIGGRGNNALFGNAMSNRLIGGEMGDLLDGREGADYMAGGKGSDQYFVDNAGDVVVELIDAGTNDQVTSTISYELTDNVEHLVLAGNAAINGNGNGLSNKLYGNAANNMLDGGAGDDNLFGGAGADTLTGGAGKDVFRFVSASDSTISAMDHITDFVHGQDKLDLRAIDANSKTAGNDAFKFIGTADFSHKAGELRYEVNDSHTLVQGDMNGDGMADFAVQLDGYTSVMNSSDFML